MKKRLKNSIISIMLALMMVVTYTPLAGITGIENSTAEAYTQNCSIGDEHYRTLSDAVKAAKNGDTIMLTDNVSTWGRFGEDGDRIILNDGKKITLDLNGYRFKYPSEDMHWRGEEDEIEDDYGIMVSGSGTELTIKDNRGYNDYDQVEMAIMVDGGTLNIEGGKFYSQIVLRGESAVLNHSDGELHQYRAPTLKIVDGGTYNYSGGYIHSGGGYAVEGTYTYSYSKKNNKKRQELMFPAQLFLTRVHS